MIDFHLKSFRFQKIQNTSSTLTMLVIYLSSTIFTELYNDDRLLLLLLLLLLLQPLLTNTIIFLSLQGVLYFIILWFPLSVQP